MIEIRLPDERELAESANLTVEDWRQQTNTWDNTERKLTYNARNTPPKERRLLYEWAKKCPPPAINKVSERYAECWLHVYGQSDEVLDRMICSFNPSEQLILDCHPDN